MSAVLEVRELSASYLATLQHPLIGQFDLLASAPGSVARLRELILSLAVQGKLLPQDPTDEPASVLLEKIRAEKERLVVAGKAKRDKPLAPIADEETPFSLPHSWRWIRLAALCTLENGDRGPNYPSKQDFVSEGLAFINAGHLKNGRIDHSEMNFISHERFKLLRTGKVQKNDILYCLRGSLGKNALITDDLAGAIASSLVIVRAASGFVPAYAMQYFASPLSVMLIRRFDNGTAQPNLGANDLARFVVPLPPLAEQSRIVARVGELMALCDALEVKEKLENRQHARLVATLFDALATSESAHALAENWQRVAEHFDLLLDRPEAVDALEQTILQLAVRGLLVPQDPMDEPAGMLLERIRTEKERLVAVGQIKRDKPLPPITDEDKPFELPVGWEWVRLNQLLVKIGAGSTPLGGREVYVSTGVKFLRSQNVWNNGLRLHDVAFIKPETHLKMAGTMVAPGDILFNITGASIGRCAVVPTTFDEANVSQHVTIIRPTLRTITSYLHLVLISSHVQQTVMDVQVGVSREGLSIGKLGQFLVPLPPLAEQSRIVARIAELRQLCAVLRERLTTTRSTQAKLAEALVEQAA